MTYRKNALSLTKAERATFIHALEKLKNIKSDYMILRTGFGVYSEEPIFIEFDFYNYLHSFAVKTTELNSEPYCPDPKVKPYDLPTQGLDF